MPACMTQAKRLAMFHAARAEVSEAERALATVSWWRWRKRRRLRARIARAEAEAVSWLLRYDGSRRPADPSKPTARR